MARVISVVNQKGGVGKTTTMVSVASILTEEHKLKVLAIDLDPQGNASSGLGLEKNSYRKCIYNVLINDCDLEGVIYSSSLNSLKIIPATIQLAGAEIELVGELSRENKLKRALSKAHKDYDVIIIDCPPSLGLLTVNALAASTDLLIPLQCEYFALEGLTQLLSTIDLVKSDLNPMINILGVLLTMADHRTNLTSQIIEEVQKHIPQHVFNTVISRNVKLSEAPSHGLPIIYYDPKSKGALNYREFTEEFVKCLHQKEY